MVSKLLSLLSRTSHLSGSHASYTHAIDYNPIVKELIWLAKKFNYRFTQHKFRLKMVLFFAASKKTGLP